MDNRSSTPEFITVEGYVEVSKYGPLYFVVMLMVFLLVFFSNFLIISLICIHPNLHEPMYIFIAALCLNSVAYASIIYPKLLIDFLSKKQVVSYAFCLFQWFSYYTLGAFEFMLLSAMSFDRYLSICKPLQYSTLMRKSNVCVLLVVALLYPTSLTVISLYFNVKRKFCHFVFKGIICNSMTLRLLCSSFSALSIYGLFTFANVAVLPVLFILYTYSRIFFLARQSKHMRRKAVETCIPHVLVLINFTVCSTYDVLLSRIDKEYPKTVRFIVTMQMIIYHPLLNPLIYGLKMKEINRHIRNLLCSC